MPAKIFKELMPAQTTVSGTNSDTYGPAQQSGFGKGLIVYVNRTADTGTTTMDVFLQGLISPGADESVAANWADVSLGLVPQYAGGATGVRVGMFGPGMTGQDTGSDDVSATVRQANGLLPLTYRLRVRNGGTTVTNTFAAITGVEIP